MDTIHQRFERPNTVSGLEHKRAELVRYRDALEAEIRKVTCDIDHLEAAVRLFDPEATPNAIKRYVVRHRAKKGTLKAFLLDQLREASAPLTSLELTNRWLAARSLRVDEQTQIVMRKRIGASLIAYRNRGILANEGEFEGLKGWVVA